MPKVFQKTKFLLKIKLSNNGQSILTKIHYDELMYFIHMFKIKDDYKLIMQLIEKWDQELIYHLLNLFNLFVFVFYFTVRYETQSMWSHLVVKTLFKFNYQLYIDKVMSDLWQMLAYKLWFEHKTNFLLEYFLVMINKIGIISKYFFNFDLTFA